MEARRVGEMDRMYIHGGGGMGMGEGPGKRRRASHGNRNPQAGAADVRRERQGVVNRCAQCGGAAACVPSVPKGQTINTYSGGGSEEKHAPPVGQRARAQKSLLERAA